ncbi:MAG: hypothetical protein ACTHM4_14145 [Rhodanobacteraceae bacterium]
MATQQQKATLGDLPAALMNLFNAQRRLGTDLFESLTGQPAPSVDDVSKLGRSLGFGVSSCRPRTGCCAIPPPCWMPQSLGECASHVAKCNTACIRLVITNCDRAKRTITVQATGAGASRVTLSPPSVVLSPQGRATVTACVSVPDDAKNGDKVDTLLWVRGCKEYYLRWTVSVGTIGIDSCHEIEVCDCPDYLHHWYDHFYCARPCPQDRTHIGVSAHG